MGEVDVECGELELAKTVDLRDVIFVGRHCAGRRAADGVGSSVKLDFVNMILTSSFAWGILLLQESLKLDAERLCGCINDSRHILRAGDLTSDASQSHDLVVWESACVAVKTWRADRRWSPRARRRASCRPSCRRSIASDFVICIVRSQVVRAQYGIYERRHCGGGVCVFLRCRRRSSAMATRGKIRMVRFGNARTREHATRARQEERLNGLCIKPCT